MSKFEIYCVDTETTGLNEIINEPIEISIQRISDGNQKTWWIKPINFDHISADALRVNGHKIEDITWQTKFGRDKYLEPAKVLVEIEGWLAEDFLPADDKLMLGQNVGFDKLMLLKLWEKCNSIETFPFNKKYSLDTMQIEFFMDYCKDEIAEGYSLFALCKKYGIKNDKAHSAFDDVKSAVSVFKKQVEKFKKLI